MGLREAVGVLVAARRSRRRDVLWIAAIALACFATARSSLLLAFQPEGIAAVWPPAGLFLSAILLTRRDLRPVLAGVLCATDFMAEWLAGTPPLVSAIYALAVTSEAVLGSWLLLRFVGPSIDLGRVRDVTAWLLLSVLLSSALTAVVPAVASMSLPGAHSFWMPWHLWAASDAVGNLIVTPFVLGWASWARARSAASSRARMFEAVVLFGALTSLAFVVFARLADHHLFTLFLPYVVFPFLTWAALRFEGRGVATAVLVLAVIAVQRAAAGLVPAFSFAPGALDDVMVVQLFLAVTAVPALLAAAVVAERRAFDAARVASDDRFRRAIVESPFPILLHAEDGSIVQASRSWYELTGYAPEDLGTIADWTERAYGDRKDVVHADIDALYALDHRKYLGDHTIRIKDGTTRVWEFSSAPLGRLPDGCRLIMSMALDVTERRLAEETLRRSEEKYRDLVENINDVLYTINADGIITYLSSAVRRLAGYEPADLVGRPFADVVHPDDLPEVARRFGEVQRNRIEPWEFRYRTKDGRIQWARSSSRPSLEDGRPAGIHGLLTDITDRKLAEDALREREARLRAILDATPFPIAVVDMEDDRIHYWSRNALAIFGHTAPTTEEWYQIAYPDPDYRREVIARWKQHLEIARETRQPVNTGEYRVTCKDGAVRVCELYASFLPDALVVVFSDITERKRAEAEKARLEIQLRQAQKMESVGRLAGGVAHDFNNMLGVILGYAELALKRVDPAQPLHADLGEIRKAAVRSADLTRQLLAFARKQTIAPKVLDVNAAVAAALHMLRRLIGEEIDLRWQPQADLWPILMDPSQIDQILTNLCVNSRDAITGIGRVTIETGECSLTDEYCAAHPGFTPGDYVILAVSDDGCGMDQDVLSHLFEPFFTTKAVGQGTGLGLATVYGIVKQNNGSVHVYSEPGHGTTFRIYLPRHVAGPGQGRAPGAAPPGPRGHETILLVEDEAAILKLVARMLTSQGYTVLAASTPGEAVRLGAEYAGEIDLLMTDVVMPEMNGRELARTLLALYPNLKCLFSSGYTADIIAHRGVLADGAHFIQKPFSIEDLAAKVREALDSAEIEGT